VKVVAIQGSPHRGNTYDRVERFGHFLVSLGDVSFEHIPLKDVYLEPCRGCFACFTQGEGACPLDDDRAEIQSSLDGSDAVVFATPVYSMHASYLLKLFVDRFAYTFHRPRYFGKYAVGLAVTGAVGLTETLKYIRMFAGAWGFEYVGDLRYDDPPRGTSMPSLSREKDRTMEVARRLHRRMQLQPARRLTLNDHLMFHVMRAVYARMEICSPADYEYWRGQGWLEPEVRYFMDHARVGVLKGLYARLVAWMMGRSMDRRLGAPHPSSDGNAQGTSD